MISIGNSNSYISLASTVKNSSNKNNPGTEENKIKIISSYDSRQTSRSLNLYNELAISQHQQRNTQTNKDNLSYSTLAAINQYTSNYNIEQAENMTKLLGLSVYA